MTIPEDFRIRTKKLLPDEFEQFENSLAQTPPTSIRLNSKIKPTIEGKDISWCNSGIYLNERPLFTADPQMHGGAYYVQEASSMFLYQAVKQYLGNVTRVLDLCAAPGGKSTLLSQALPPDCLLISNEISKQRVQILAENIIKWGNNNVVVSNNEAPDFDNFEHYFDAVIIDAPCSGEGMFRKDATAIQEWSVDNVKLCTIRQKNIVSDIWDTVKPGGFVIYSTCTFNREENEENIHWICSTLGAEIQWLNQISEGIVKSDAGYRFYPHRVAGEGFFLSILRKNEGNVKTFQLKKQSNYNFLDYRNLPITLIEPDKYSYLNENNKIIAYKKDSFEELMFIKKQLRCFVHGIELFELKGKDYIPSAQLALSKEIDKNSCQHAEVDYQTAIQFLKREAIQLQNEPIGYLLISYNRLALGWVKNIGNRCNNLYPQHWRIRMNL